ncbi:hypothetical protein Anapl_05640 [Anas platyrhynchos]|uniref:Uncharacterized protein n=1 Tax=Anas platyrhynchos TaxID=8839 RepID=R0LQJ2_ANAPL|nr:hypothetical protein Anapl_05640 [Anas platyrhynchos]
MEPAKWQELKGPHGFLQGWAVVASGPTARELVTSANVPSNSDIHLTRFSEIWSQQGVLGIQVLYIFNTKSQDQICQKLTVSGSHVARDSQSASTSNIQHDISNKCASEEERDSSGPMSPVGSAIFGKLFFGLGKTKSLQSSTAPSGDLQNGSGNTTDQRYHLQQAALERWHSVPCAERLSDKLQLYLKVTTNTECLKGAITIVIGLST